MDNNVTSKIFPFGAYQRYATIFFLVILQITLFLALGSVSYAILFLKYKMMIILLIISILQGLVTRSDLCINLINKYVQPKLYFNKMEKIYHEKWNFQEQKDKNMFAMHPHSVLSYGLLMNMNQQNDKMGSMIGLVSRAMLLLPIVGLILRLWGIQSVHGKSLDNLMNKGSNIGLVPGGFEEATITTPLQYRLFLKKRKGFIKYALKYRYRIIPTLIFNQHKAFYTFDYFLNFRLWINKFKIPAVLFINLKTLFILPIHLEIITIVGKPIETAQYECNVSKDVVNVLHAQYMAAIELLYKKYKKLNGNVPLNIY